MSIYVQYQNSTRLNTLLDGIETAIRFTDNDRITWINNYLSIETASTDGLDNWGRILGQNRIVPAGIGGAKNVLGFDTGIPPAPINDGYPQNFDNGNFYDSSHDSSTVVLVDDAYRVLLKILYLKYTTNNSIASLNLMIQSFAGNRGEAYVLSGNMSISYVFNFTLKPFEINLFENTDCLPVPAGITLNLIFN